MPDPAMNPILLVIYFAGTILASMSTLWFKDRIDHRKSMEKRITDLEEKVEARDEQIDGLQTKVVEQDRIIHDLRREVEEWKIKYALLERRLEEAHDALKGRSQAATPPGATREEKIEQAASLRKAGVSVPQIAERLEVHKSTVYRWLKVA